MSEILSEPIRWLWWPYIAIGKLCMLDGDPGIGKSLLTIQIAARLSRADPLPDQQGKPTLHYGGPQTTLLLSTEDGLADTIKPAWKRPALTPQKFTCSPAGWAGKMNGTSSPSNNLTCWKRLSKPIARA
jgi:AAA domain